MSHARAISPLGEGRVATIGEHHFAYRRCCRRPRAQRKDYSTNVLTFVYDDVSPLSGDIVLCAPVVAAEAKQQKKNLQAHYAHLALHGVLHLQGYDHEKNRDAKIMETLEADIMQKLGYANPYQDEQQ
jgi:probable rRNA maturation factor